MAIDRAAVAVRLKTIEALKAEFDAMGDKSSYPADLFNTVNDEIDGLRQAGVTELPAVDRAAFLLAYTRKLRTLLQASKDPLLAHGDCDAGAGAA